MSETPFHHHPDHLPEETLAPLAPKLRRPPFWIIAAFMVLTIATWIPLVIFARARTKTFDEPRVQLVQDMGSQPKYREQQSSDVFADGKTEVKFFDGFPKQVKISEVLLKRGQERFNIYCSACHGYDGSGDGAVNERAMQLNELDSTGNKWTKAASLHQDNVRARPNGHLYNTINVGIRNMPSYGAQIPAEDRWAIVAYVRALQLSQNAPPNLASKDTADAVSQK
jgi:mono/diheme cytochrome c family protein